ncbi:hypothetical protein OSB04_004733 [Centaurea solstitialis]|uniref:Uncharacterized protein n=1 Tax=Centaurea solstitialis TaxID=347529 RepID=A0AA38TEM6_9ASTR|nr:hypothetical protein OSB04_004733 [Centaurea solstitialis]
MSSQIDLGPFLLLVVAAVIYLGAEEFIGRHYRWFSRSNVILMFLLFFLTSCPNSFLLAAYGGVMLCCAVCLYFFITTELA